MKIKKISAALLCSAALVTGSSFAQGLAASFLEGYDLPPHEAQVIDGNWFSNRILNCHVRADKPGQNPLIIESKKHRVVVNGVILPEGSTMTVLANVGTQIEFEVDTRGQFSITNDSDNLLNIRCD